MFDVLFEWKRIREKHKAAPLLRQRELYLTHLVNEGNDLDKVRQTANLLLHIVRSLAIVELREITPNEIAVAGRAWALQGDYSGTSDFPNHAEAFCRISAKFFSFHGRLLQPARSIPFSEVTKLYVAYLQARSLSAPTINGYGGRLRRFFKWLHHRGLALPDVRVVQIDQFLDDGRAKGWKPRTIANFCQALRSFFKFAEGQGLCAAGIARGIKSPRTRPFDGFARGPSWRAVRRIVEPPPKDARPAAYRRHIVCVLCSLYGLRTSEIARLELNDFDWEHEILTVRRAKKGGVQQFPLVFEAGEAIIAYLRYARPRCACRRLLVTRTTPHRPVTGASLWPLVSRQIRERGIKSINVGPHSLRHSCATRLLRVGTSLQELASFLGHKGLKTVAVYARHDPRMLRAVSKFSLRSML